MQRSVRHRCAALRRHRTQTKRPGTRRRRARRAATASSRRHDRRRARCSSGRRMPRSKRSATCAALRSMLSCVSMTPLGYEVVPDVNCISSTSPGVTSSKTGSSQVVAEREHVAERERAARHIVLRARPRSSSFGSCGSGSAVSIAGQTSRSIAMKSIFRKRSATKRSFTSACFRQYASSSRFEARVDRHRDGANRRRRVEENHPLDAVAHAHGDVIAAFYAERAHAARHIGNSVLQLAVRQAVFADDERFLLREKFRIARQRVAERLSLPLQGWSPKSRLL